MNTDEKNHILKLFEAGSRLDGRTLTDYRKEVTVEYGVSSTAEGSARVKIGGTEIIAGVKLELGTPYPDTPDQGTLIVGAELLPLSSPEFEPGPPGIQAIELARVIDRGVRESNCIDVKKLCITQGEKVWNVIVDICTINDEGNLFDAASLGLMAALKDTKFPKIVDDKISYKEKTKTGLPLKETTVSTTILKIGDYLIVDPLSKEEEVADARLTIATKSDGTLCAMQKGGNHPLRVEDIKAMVALGAKKCDELRGKL